MEAELKFLMIEVTYIHEIWKWYSKLGNHSISSCVIGVSKTLEKMSRNRIGKGMEV
jgi:hypothetical protein